MFINPNNLVAVINYVDSDLVARLISTIVTL